MFKDSSRLFTNIAIMIATPVLILLLNSLFIAMNTDTFGNQMIVSFNLMIILLVALNTSSYAASVYSRDGRSAYLIKVQPKNPTPLLIAKLIPTTVFNIISFIITFVILLSTTRIAFIDCVYIILGVTFIYLAHLMYSAGLEIINPHTEIYAALGEYENDPNEIKSTAYAFAASFIATGAVLLLLITNDKALYLKLFLVGLAIFLIATRRFLSNIKLYYKDN